MSLSDALSIAQHFASCLDRDDFISTKALLHGQCEYHLSAGVVWQGPDSIVASYRKNAEEARVRFDAIEYTSEVVATEDETVFEVRFLDVITKNDIVHRFRCHQLVHVHGTHITRIVHRELEGERDRLRLFLQATGVALGS